MADESSKVESDGQMLAEAQQHGLMATLSAYMRMSGPGWLQSAITLGGGSLGASLYLGVLGGYSLLWVQPFAMVLGIIMLSAIGYVTLSTGDRPFRAINEHVNPVLGWSWALAVAAANVVWCLPQYALANGVLSQNLLPGLLGDEGWLTEKATEAFGAASYWATHSDELLVTVGIFVVTVIVTWSYDRGGWGLKLYELMLKIVVMLIVLCFVGVVLVLSFPVDATHTVTSETEYYTDGPQQSRPPDGKFAAGTQVTVVEQSDDSYWSVKSDEGTEAYVAAGRLRPIKSKTLEWGKIFAGFVPDFSKLFRPADTFIPLLDQIGPAGNAVRDYWSDVIVDQQRDVIISAAATAVGINMTFLFAYSLLRKGWTKEFRGLVRFDLATGMLIPFLLATSCVVIAAASQFHTEPGAGFYVDDRGDLVVPKNFLKSFESLMNGRTAAKDKATQKGTNAEAAGKQLKPEQLTAIRELESPTTLPEMELASTLVKRDAFQLAQSLRPVAGRLFADYVFGFGVLAMTLSTITILMLISGFVFCELLGLPPGGWAHRLGTLVAGLGGALGPFVWKQAAFYLVVPTSVFGFILLPLAYLTFFLLMNQKDYLGDDAPTGMRRFVWNLLMGISASIATIGSIYMVYVKAGVQGLGAVGLLVMLAVMVHFNRRNTRKYDQQERGAQKKKKQ